MKTGGLVVLKGNLAPDGALIKVAGLKSLVFEGRARVFDSEEAAPRWSRRRRYKAGDVLVIRYEGPNGGPGNARDARRDRADLRAGHGREGGAAHRRALLRRDARHDGRLRLAGSRGRRAARAGEEWRPHPHRRARRERWTCRFRRPSCKTRKARRAEALRYRACWRSTPRWSARRTSARSPTAARPVGEGPAHDRGLQQEVARLFGELGLHFLEAARRHGHAAACARRARRTPRGRSLPRRSRRPQAGRGWRAGWSSRCRARPR